MNQQASTTSTTGGVQPAQAQGASNTQTTEVKVENKINTGDSAATVANNATTPSATPATTDATQQTSSSGGGMDIKTDRKF